jgi:hypothetical protein
MILTTAQTGCFAFRAGSLPQLVEGEEEEEREERIPHYADCAALSLAPPATPATLRTNPLSSTYLPILHPHFLIHFKKAISYRSHHSFIHSSIQQSSVLKKKKIL